MNIDFRGGSVYVRNNLSFREGQKVTTENGTILRFHSSVKDGNIRWFNFKDEEGKIRQYRMMAFPYLHAMGEKISMRDNLGPIDVRISVVKSINRSLVNLLK